MPFNPRDPELWGQVVSAAVVPVVMISACGLLTSSFYNRLTAILTRLRFLAREALDDLDHLASRKTTGETQRHERRSRARRTVAHRREQADQLLQRAGLMRRAIFCMLSAVFSLVLCSLSIGAGVFARPSLYFAAAFFVLGMASIVSAVLYAMSELRVSLAAIRQEHDLIDELAEELEGAGEGKEKGSGSG